MKSINLNKIFGYFILALLLILILLVLSVILIQLPVVQTYMGNQAKEYIASRLDTKFEVEDIEINIYDKIKMSGVYIEDEAGDTLLYASELFMDLDGVKLIGQEFTVQDIRITDGKIRLHKDENGSNYDFLIDEFARYSEVEVPSESDNKESEEPSAWDISFGNLNIINTDIDYSDETTGESLQLYVGNIDIDANETDIENKVINVSRASMADLKVAYIKGGDLEDDDPNSKPFKLEDIGWDIVLSSLEVKNSAVAYAEKAGMKETPGRVNFQNLSFTEVDLSLKNVLLKEDDLSLVLTNLNAKEQSGFKLDNISTNLSMTSKKMNLENLLVSTANSTLGKSATLKYKSFEDFRDFEKRVFFTFDAEKTAMRFQDLQYFLPPDVMSRIGGIMSTDEQIRLDGVFKGRVSNFRATDLVIRAGENTYYEGSVKWRGLPDFQNSFIDFRINELRTRADDLQSIMADIDMPQEFKNLGDVSFRGNFTGFPKDFVADGTLVTSLGSVDGDINMKAKGALPKYSGFISTQGFELGKFLNREDDFGSVALNTRVRGQGFELDVLDAQLDGNISHIGYKGNDYSNIKLDGRFVQRLFTGKLNVDDDNLKMDFAGTVDLNEEEPVLSFASEIRDANLKNLNFVKDDLLISTNADLALSGNNIDNIKGSATFKDISIRRGDQQELIEEVKLYSVINEDSGERLLQIDSEYLAAQVAGRYDFNGLAAAFQNFINHYFPLEFQESQYAEEQDLDFEIEILQPILFADLLVPKLSYVSEGLLEGYFNNVQKKLDLDFELDSLVYDNYRLDEFALEAISDQEKIAIKSTLAELNIGDQLALPDVAFVGDVKDYKLDFDLTVSEDDPENGVDIAGVVESNFKSANLLLDKMDVRTRGVLWKGQLEDAYFKNKEDYYIKEFVLAHTDQSIRVNSLDGKEGGPVQILLNDFRLDEFASIAKKDHLLIKGVSNGEVQVEQLFLNPVLTGDLNVLDFEFLGKPLGNLDVQSRKHPGIDEIEIDGTLTENGNEVKIFGKYYTVHNPDIVIHGKQSNVDLNVTMEKLQLEWLEALMGSIIADTKGYAKGNVKLYGDIRQPSLHGDMRVIDGETRVLFLNTALRIDEQVLTLRDKKILFDNMFVEDKFANQAFANGFLNINDYKNPSIDVLLESDHFLFLDTYKGYNGTFYGTAFGEGSASFTGPLRDLKMQITAKSHPDTKISFPLEDEQDVIQSQHIFTFVQPEEEVETEIVAENEVERKLDVDIDLEVTEDAEIEIIFDQAAGDIIRSTGNGDISVNYKSTGDFNVYGTYTIAEGDYLFTMQEVVKKQFIVKPNSTVSFYGSPYDAELEVDAIYGLKTSLSDLPGFNGTSSSSQRVPVDVNMKLRGSLSDTDIQFAIELPDQSTLGNNASEVEPAINAINDNVDSNELNRQVFGLLVFNKFLPDEVLQGNELIGESVNATMSEFVSNQFSKLLNETLSEFIPDSDFSVKWRKYNGETDASNLGSGNEFELLYTQRLFNDRVSIDIGGNLDVGKDIEDSDNSNIAVAGDFVFQYLITEEGNFRLKVYGKSTDNTPVGTDNAAVAGIALFASEEFDNWEDLKQNLRNRRAKRKLRKQKEKKAVYSGFDDGN